MSVWGPFLWMWRRVVAWFRPNDNGHAPAPPAVAVVAPPLTPPPEPPLAPVPLMIEPPAAELKIEATLPVVDTPPVVYADWNRPGKWVKPKGQKPEPKPRAEKTEPRAPPKEKPQLLPPKPEDDPEQWGQYYFRDVILDQLDMYWVYLRRMKRGDRSNYGLLRQVGIQLMPYSTTRTFDKLRHHEGEDFGLTPWWRTHRPTFGAVAYGFDDVAIIGEQIHIADIADPDYEKKHADMIATSDKLYSKLDGSLKYRPTYLIKPDVKYDRKQFLKARDFWTPRFLYFYKYERAPKDLEHVVGNGDTYGMTVYWDNCGERAPKYIKSKRAGGIPQEYGLWVERDTNRVRVLKSKLHSKITLNYCRGPRGGKLHDSHTTFDCTQWTVPDRFLTWCHGYMNVEPESYLRRLFIEAANLYETSVLGSMIRVAVSKDDLTATFGVDVKRMAYFFKDRDVVLSQGGSTKRIFHIVRPHIRKDGAKVPMHFRGLKKFVWAGYNVEISVPFRDHISLLEVSVGMHDMAMVPREEWHHYIGGEKMGKKLVDAMKQGTGGKNDRVKK